MSDSRTQVLLMLPVFQSMYPQAVEAFLRLALNAGATEHARYCITPVIVPRTLLHAAMNRAASDAITHGFDVLIFADDDCLPPHDAVSRLLRHYEAGREFVAGLGFMRGFPHTTTVGRYDPAGPTLHVDDYGATKLAGFRWIDDVSDEPDDLVACDFCGFPIAMVSVKALARLERPWFGTATPLGECTHDVFFGDRARLGQLALAVDRTIVCDHLGDQTLITPASRQMARAAVRQALQQRATGVAGGGPVR